MMTRHRKMIIAAIASMLVAPAFAHIGGHGDEGVEMTQEQATIRASDVVTALMKQNKLNSTWSKRVLKETVSRDSVSGKLWVVVYTNPAETDASRQTLYVLFDQLGNFLDATHRDPVASG